MNTTNNENAAATDNKCQLVNMTATIVAAHVSNNPVSTDELPALIANVHNALGKLEEGGSKPLNTKPAVPIKESVTDDHIICLEDGKKFQSLKRHLRTYYNLTPEEYRAKWRLPHDYPMVAPNYARRRSQLARDMGLGRKPRNKDNALKAA